jgi:arsenate reductase (thioredoxin)
VAGRIYNVLFLCTGNSARSVMAEAILNELGKGRFKAFSAGSHPTGQINPYTIEQLKKQGHPVDRLASKSWSVFEKPDAPRMDMIVTVCDNAAGEVCPVWPGKPATAHWGFEDPAAFEGPHEAKAARFSQIYIEIMARVRLLMNLPVERLDHLALEGQLRSIGKRTHDVGS